MQGSAETDIDLEVFGRLVRVRRKSIGWTLEDLADSAFSNSVRKGYVSQIEYGQKNIGLEQVRSLCRALEISRLEIPASLRWFEPPKEGQLSVSFPEDTALYEGFNLLSMIAGRPIDYTGLPDDILHTTLRAEKFEFSSILDAVRGLGLITSCSKQIAFLVQERENGLEVVMKWENGYDK